MLTDNFNKKNFSFKFPPISIGIGAFIIFAAIIGLYIFHKYNLVSTQQANLGAIRADSEKIKGDIQESKRLTLEAMRAYIAYQKARNQQKSQTFSLLQQILRQRKDQLTELTEKDPAQVLKLLLPKNIREALSQVIAEDIESDITTEGILAIFHEDDFDALKSRTNYILQSSQGDFSLHTPRQFGDLVSNTKVRVKGVRIGNKIIINDPDKELKILQRQIFSSPESKSSSIIKRILRRQEARAITDDTFGDQKTAVILVNFLDNTSQPWTPAYVRGVIFNNPDSVNAYYKEISFNQTSLSGEVFGWYTLPISATCSYSTIFNEAIKVSDSDIYFPPYSRIIIAFPRLSGCTWGGLGTIGQTTFSSADGSFLVASQAWINGFMDLRVVGHELGHNLGVHHATGYDCDAGVLEGACTTWGYGDPFDIMGRSQTGHHNSPHKDYLKWLTAAGGIYKVTNDGTYTLEPLEAAGGIKMLEIPKDTDKSKWYFLEYRQATGFDSYLSSNSNVINGLLVHYGPYVGGKYYTQLLDMTPGTASLTSDFDDAALIIGATYTDKLTGTSFTPLGKTETGIQIKVKIPATACIKENPTVSINPISQWGSSGSSLSYTVNVTNNDNSLCSSSTFTLVSAVPAGWTSKFDISSLTLVPGATGSTAITVTSPAAISDGFYDFSVSATNSAVPTYNSSTTATYVVADIMPPTVSITFPTSGKTVSNTITVSADASDDRGIAGVQFKLDGSNLGAEDATVSYTITWDTTTASNGSHILTAIARDIAGNLTTSNDVIVIVSNIDTVSPTVSITSPANGITIKRGSTVTISASASDNVGVIKVEFYVNSTLTCTDTTTPYSCSWKAPMAKGKIYTLQAKAYDAAGNQGNSVTVKVTAK